jgi:hypothetical protein
MVLISEPRSSNCGGFLFTFVVATKFEPYTILNPRFYNVGFLFLPRLRRRGKLEGNRKTQPADRGAASFCYIW